MELLHDIDVYGRENPDGSSVEHFENACTKNALICWLTSKRGDFLLNPTEGGVLDSAEFKNLSDQNIDRLIFRIKNAIINNFVPSITLRGLDVVPNYEERYLEINILYSDPVTKKQESVTIYTNTPSEIKKWTYEDVPYEGENLRNFILLKKPENMNTKLLFNVEENCWIWGKFKFINFNISSENFDEILTLCNLT